MSFPLIPTVPSAECLEPRCHFSYEGSAPSQGLGPNTFFKKCTLFVCVDVCLYVGMCTLELELQTFLSYLTWVQGTKGLHLYRRHPEFSERVGKASDFERLLPFKASRYLPHPCHALRSGLSTQALKGSLPVVAAIENISLLDLSQSLTPPQAREGSSMGSGAPVRDASSNSRQ